MDDTPTAPGGTDLPTEASLGMNADGTRIVIGPHWLTLDTIGVTGTFSATVIDAAGDTLDAAEVTWESADTAVATIDTAGVVTSVAFGLTKVSATYDSATAQATVEVALPLTDRQILEIFFEATGGENWTDNTNWLSEADLDDWFGVRAHQGKVSDLSLDDNNLVGTIPPELGGLDKLSGLVLRYNELSGAIPAELSKFESLRGLFLDDNAEIGGRLPPELGYTAGLEYLTVSSTNLTGPVPLTFANLELIRFYFDKDGVCIPAALKEWLDSIPQKEEEYELCTDKIFIDPPSLYIEAPPIGDTARLTAAVITAEGDTVPDMAVTWTSADTAIATVDSTGLVTSVDYGTTQVTATSDWLTATAEVEIVFKLSNRQVLDTLYRRTGGENWTDTTNWRSDAPLSDWFGVETNEEGKVVGLSLGENNLAGSIPSVIAELGELVTLDLGRNALAGRIPRELRELLQLRDLLLNGNALEGPLPEEVGYMAGLRYLNIGSNKLSGVVPRSFADLELDTLYAVGSGVCVPPSLDEWFDGIGQTDEADRCVASIAIEIVDLPTLTFYAVGETGDLTATYVSAEGDSTPEASVTWTSGDAAVASVSAAGRVTAVGTGETEVTATYDSTTGTIAVEVALPETDRDVLEILYDRARGSAWAEGTNWLSDEPLSEWAGVETNDVLVTLYSSTGGPEWRMRQNWTGEGSLNTWSGIVTDAEGYVTEIFLPWNNLTDSIPPELGNLTRLEVLALFGNELTGRIPPELGKLTTVRDFSLSSNKLGGPIPPEIGGMVSVDTMYLSGNQLSGPIPPRSAILPPSSTCRSSATS